MTIAEIVDRAVQDATKQMGECKLDLRSIIYQAVQAGMADAYERGVSAGQKA